MTTPSRRTLILALAVALTTAAIAVGGIGVLANREGRGGALGAPHFLEEAARAGIAHTYDGDFTFYVGGGVAAFDCNGDGKSELYVAGGTNPATLYRNESATAGPLRFAPITSPATDLPNVVGAYPIDIDSDGVTDLVVLSVGGAHLLRGAGDCHFEPADSLWQFQAPRGWVTAFSATWEGRNAMPTLAFGRYLDLSAGSEDSRTCDTSLIFRPGSSGYAPPIALAPGFCSLSVLFSDWDRSGRRDLRVSNDRHYYDQSVGQEQLWRVAPGQAPRLYTAQDGWAEVQIEGMGIASYDVTGDGYPEVFLTSQGANRLQTLTNGPSQPTYGDIGSKRGANATRPFAGGDPLPSTAWHDEFQDVNNDGYVDLFVAKGNIDAQPDFAAKDPSNLLLGQADGTFIEGAEQAGILNYARGRGAALVDLNLDGLIDLVEVNRRAPAGLWRNVGAGDDSSPRPMGNWLALRLHQDAPNVDGIGAWIEVRVGDRTLTREVTIGGGHASGELGWIHVGLGTASRADVRVTWPNGEVGPWQSVDANQFVTLAPGHEVQPWQP